MPSASTVAFTDFAESVQTEIDDALKVALADEPGCPPNLAEAMRYSVLGPGKRLRPLLVLMAAEACGCPRGRAMPAACAVELIHAYSLVHDDLPAMDDDDMRRGRPSCHRAYDEATAILVGDALQARAFELLATEIHPPEVAARCCGELAHAAGRAALVGGQSDDLAAEGRPGSEVLLRSIHQRKTGALIRVSLRLGAIAAGAGERQVSCLDEIGSRVGTVFQITDDLLDLEGDPAAIGKRTQKDRERGKLTYPGLLGVEESRRQAEQLTEEACRRAEELGDGQRLQALARYVLERSR